MLLQEALDGAKVPAHPRIAVDGATWVLAIFMTQYTTQAHAMRDFSSALSTGGIHFFLVEASLNERIKQVQ